MSLQTWKEEFYPIEASEVTDKIEAIKHSLRKWTGLLEKNLKKHDVKLLYEEYEIRLEDFIINFETCALCQLFDVQTVYYECPNCPFVYYLNHRCCGYIGSPWHEFIYYKDPKPMIAALEKMLKLEEHKQEVNRGN